jgi:hypothetical protein
MMFLSKTQKRWVSAAAAIGVGIGIAGLPSATINFRESSPVAFPGVSAKILLQSAGQKNDAIPKVKKKAALDTGLVRNKDGKLVVPQRARGVKVAKKREEGT